MNKNQIQELLMGAAVVALGYALWRHFKPAAKNSTLGKMQNTMTPQANGIPYDTANPGGFIGLTNLLRGAVHDIYAGDTAGESTPTTSEIFASVTQDTYANGNSQTYSDLRGDTGADSIVRINNGEWWQQ